MKLFAVAIAILFQLSNGHIQLCAGYQLAPTPDDAASLAIKFGAQRLGLSWTDVHHEAIEIPEATRLNV